MGVAHTYLAAEALRKAAQERGVTIKVETNGAVGVNDELESDEIAAGRLHHHCRRQGRVDGAVRRQASGDSLGR